MESNDHFTLIGALVALLFFPALVLIAKYEISKRDKKELELENKELQKQLAEQNRTTAATSDKKTPPIISQISQDEISVEDASELATIRHQCESEFFPKKNWESALIALDSFINLAPDDSFGWFYTAYVLHELKRTNEAIETLQYAITNLKDDGQMHLARVKMACYECSLGNLERAKDWLLEAKRLAGVVFVKHHVDTDDDLAALRAWVRFI